MADLQTALESDVLYPLEQTILRLEQQIRPVLAALPPNPEARERLEAVIRLSKLVIFYFRETMKCFEGKAFFAANVVGAATLETLLLLMCLLSEGTVRSTKTWRMLYKGKTKPFLKVLGGMDLAKLIDIGNEMNWFLKDAIPERFRTIMVQHFGPEFTKVLCSFVPRDGQISAEASRDARNRLHPARCVREPFEISEMDSIYATLCLLSALASFGERIAK